MSSPPILTLERTPATRISFKFAAGCALALALVLLIWKAAIVLGDPRFGGDAALRLNKAYTPLMRLGNRIWLPYLQAQIWLFYLLKLPYWAYNLIPCVHFFAAAFLLGLLGLRIIGHTISGLAFSLFVMFAFSQQRIFSQLSVTLYQEIAAAAFFYVLLYSGALSLERRWWLVVITGAALLCRDTFWIHLFAVTLLNWRRILSDSSYRASFTALWAVVTLWLLAIPLGWLAHDGRLPSFPTEWPLMINKNANRAVTDLAVSFTSLGTSLRTSRAIFLLLAGAVTLIIHVIEKPRQGVTDFARRLGPFSILTLGISYFLVILFDPWQATFGIGRISTPLLEQAFVWFLVAFAASSSYGRIARIVTRTILVLALLAGLDSRASAWYPLKNEETSRAYAEIERLVSGAAPGRRAHVCFVGGEYFRVLEEIVAPTLYASRESLPAGSIPRRCDVILVHSAARLPPSDSLAKAGQYAIRGTGYTLYLMRR